MRRFNLDDFIRRHPNLWFCLSILYFVGTLGVFFVLMVAAGVGMAGVWP